jgi:hypothetical protein
VAKQPAKGRKTPTKTQKPASQTAKTPESAAKTAPVIDAIPEEVRAKAAPAPKKTAPAAKPAAAKPKVDATVQKKPVVPEPAPKPTPPPPPKPAPAAQQNSFLPLALGGLVAGVIGFAVATFTAPQPDNTLANRIAAQSSAISELEQRLADMPETDLSGIEGALAALALRLDEIEARPAAVAAPTGDVSAVTADMDALRAQIAEMTQAAQTELSQARAAAASIEENAASAARNSAARAALSRVQTALESGAPIGAALGDLEEATGSTAPDALIAAQDGVPTLAALQEQFPEAARAALATARSEGVAGEETSGIGAFLRTQFDVRSTAPREGNDADAILSRAEAAVRTGRLSDALAEVSALPEVARGAMSDWLALAEARASAVAAADILSSTLSDN